LQGASAQISGDLGGFGMNSNFLCTNSGAAAESRTGLQRLSLTKQIFRGNLPALNSPRVLFFLIHIHGFGGT